MFSQQILRIIFYKNIQRKKKNVLILKMSKNSRQKMLKRVNSIKLESTQYTSLQHRCVSKAMKKPMSQGE